MDVDAPFAKKWLSISEASEYLGLKVSTIYHYTHKKRIPCYKVGRILRFKTSELDDFIESGRVNVEAEK